MGRLAAKTLLEKISRGDDSALNIRLEPELIVRESTAPLKETAAAGSANGTRRRKS
jgi:DNA-binding LacI/PurR family transcriptional regulator